MPKRKTKPSDDVKTSPLENAFSTLTNLRLWFSTANGLQECCSVNIKAHGHNKCKIYYAPGSGTSHIRAIGNVQKFNNYIFDRSCLKAILCKLTQIAHGSTMDSNENLIEKHPTAAQHSQLRPEEVFGSVPNWDDKLILKAAYVDETTPLSQGACKDVAALFGTAFMLDVVLPLPQQDAEKISL